MSKIITLMADVKIVIPIKKRKHAQNNKITLFL